MRREETIQKRRNYARAAAELFGACDHESLVDDLNVYYDRKTLMRLCTRYAKSIPISSCANPLPII